MADKTRVNLVVHSDTKEEWDNAVEESTEYSSLSDLIRQAVSHELSEDQPAQTANTPSEQTQAGLNALKDVTDTLARIESSLSSLDQRIGSLEDEFIASQSDSDLQNKLFKALPTPELGDRNQITGTPMEWGKTPEELAEETGATSSEVEDTLSRLEEITNTIESASGGPDNQTYYWREE